MIDDSLTLESIIEEELAAQGLDSGVVRPKSGQNFRELKSISSSPFPS
jgi:hypothetical protein